jgi:hypothetical protein
VKREIKTAREVAKLAKLLNLNVSDTEIKESARDIRAKTPPKYLLTEHCIRYLERPEAYLKKQCKGPNCNEWFVTSYHAVAYCSDLCRKRRLAELGVDYNPSAKSLEERWGGEPPMVLPTALTDILDAKRKTPQPVENLFGEVPNFKVD